VLQDTAPKRADLLAPVLKLGRADLVIGDLDWLDQSPALLSHLAEVDYVVHLGLRVPAGSDPPLVDYLASNLAPFERLLARLPAGLKGICLASSLAVYAGPCAEPVAEGFPTGPRSAFAEMKLAMELVLLQHGQRAGVPVTALRLASLYGPGELQSPRVVPSFIRSQLAGQPPVIYGDGSDVYDYLYVQDAARAVRLALEHMDIAAGIYNIGSGHGWTTRAVAETIQRQLHLALPPQHMPARGPRHVLVADINRACARLNFRPETTLEAGLAAEIAYFQAHAIGSAEPLAQENAHGSLPRVSI
jgi:nucleoside-diphosphate-sugar epimerase